MSWYAERLLPRIVNLVCSTPGVARWRRRAVEGLQGCVVEIGFGSGLNVPFYPASVERVEAVEPSDTAWRLAGRAVAASPVVIERVGLDGQRLPLADESCDGALSTFTLCTVEDDALALRELYRVLRPGGALHFLEHGLAPDARVARWQWRLDPLERRLAGGCHLTRDVRQLVERSGFVVSWCEQRYETGPRPWSYFSVGVATKPAA